MTKGKSPAALLPITRATVFFDGIFAEPVRLAHPEGVAVNPKDGSVWCGTENGDLLRIEADGSAMCARASTGGWIAGIAFGGDSLYACDIRYGGVFRLDIPSGRLNRLSDIKLNIPNYPVVDLRRNRLYVSDSHSFQAPGPGIWAFDLESGASDLWYSEALQFANGMALAPDGNSLYVVESTAQRVVTVPIMPNGSAGNAQPVVSGLAEFPDGLALDAVGNLYISCYEPSQIYRWDRNGTLAVLIRDPVATLICHPTNMAFRGTQMFTSNLGRWHITQIDIGVAGSPVPVPA
jgi:sugar lactone lactonase YvrE